MDVKLVSQGGQINFDKNTIYNELVISDKSSINSSNNGLQGESTKIKEEDVKKAVDTLNKEFKEKDTYLQYEVYGKFNNIVVKVMDKSTNELVKELPSKKIIDMVEKLCEMSGMFVDEKA